MPARGAKDISKPKRRSRRPTRQNSGSQLSDSSRQSGYHSSSTDDNKSVASGLLSPDASVASARSRGSVRAKNPVRTNKRGIDVPVQAEILGDIESFGGLKTVLEGKHGIRDFCNTQKKDDIYGEENTTKRDQVVNKIRNWGRIPYEDYEKILFGLRIWPNRLQKSDRQQPPSVVSVPSTVSKKTPAKSPAVKSAVKSPAAKAVKSPAVKANFRQPPAEIDSSDEEDPELPQRRLFAIPKMSAYGKDRAQLPVVPVEVDVDNLEGTPAPFKVRKAIGMLAADKKGLLLGGFLISMSVDVNDVLGVEEHDIPPFNFTAVVASDNEIEITAPLLEYSERGGHDELLREQIKNNANFPEKEVVMDAIDNSRKKYEETYLEDEDDEEIPKKVYRLKFSGGVKLSAKALKLHQDANMVNNRMLKTEGLTVRDTLSALNKKHKTLDLPDPNNNKKITKYIVINEQVIGRLAWRVADLSVEKQRTGASEKKKKPSKTDAAAALLGNIDSSRASLPSQPQQLLPSQPQPPPLPDNVSSPHAAAGVPNAGADAGLHARINKAVKFGKQTIQEQQSLFQGMGNAQHDIEDADMAEAGKDGKKRGKEESDEPSESQGRALHVPAWRTEAAIAQLPADFGNWICQAKPDQHNLLLNQELLKNLARLPSEDRDHVTSQSAEEQMPCLLWLTQEHESGARTPQMKEEGKQLAEQMNDQSGDSFDSDEMQDDDEH